jgi:hypothetical protein
MIKQASIKYNYNDKGIPVMERQGCLLNRGKQYFDRNSKNFQDIKKPLQGRPNKAIRQTDCSDTPERAYTCNMLSSDGYMAYSQVTVS